MNYYQAKFEREAKDNPLDWVIAPQTHGAGFELRQIGQTAATCPDGDRCSEPSVCKLIGRCNTGQPI